jgi:hypothetical protein
LIMLAKMANDIVQPKLSLRSGLKKILWNDKKMKA